MLLLTLRLVIRLLLIRLLMIPTQPSMIVHLSPEEILPSANLMVVVVDKLALRCLQGSLA